MKNKKQKRPKVKIILSDKKSKHKCIYCGHEATQYTSKEDNPVIFRANPLNSEIYGDYDKYWICEDCCDISAMDI